MLTVEQFARAVPCSMLVAGAWHPVIEKSMQKWGINTKQRAAGFLAQMSHESGKFGKFVENLNYSAKGLANTWPGRYAVDRKASPKVPNALALKIARQPEAIANLTYANRGGNGPPESGHGWKYRGRGPKQITFLENYTRCGKALGLDLVNNPDLLLVPEHGADAAGWYWSTNGCNEMMDRNDFKATSLAINGGLIGHEDGNDIGLDDRVELWVNCRAVICV